MNVFRKNRPVAQKDLSTRLKKVRRSRGMNRTSENQKKLLSSKDPFKLGPSVSTGGTFAGSGYFVAFVITVCLLLGAALIAKFL